MLPHTVTINTAWSCQKGSTAANLPAATNVEEWTQFENSHFWHGMYFVHKNVKNLMFSWWWSFKSWSSGL